MNFAIPPTLVEEREQFKRFLKTQVAPHIGAWYGQRELPRSYYAAMAAGGWFGFREVEDRVEKHSALRDAVLMEQLSMLSPGVGVATLVHQDLGLLGLWRFGGDHLLRIYGPPAVRGDILLCLGNTENIAGSDAAGIATRAEKVDGGWRLSGAKAYVTGGLISDMALITAVTYPEAERKKRMSMFLVDLGAKGVTRRRLNKQVWIPSDLTRIKLADVFVPDDHLVGEPGRGLQQLLTIFTHSRLGISALTLGTARGAFELALDHGERRRIFNHKIMEHQAKAFEAADMYARMEAARLMLYKACWAADEGRDFQFEASMAKYLTVTIARETAAWAADLFGAASVIFETPIHKFPLDAWAASLGEGTQDIQKLIIFRNVMNRYRQQ